jgi:hypothetical protein
MRNLRRFSVPLMLAFACAAGAALAASPPLPGFTAHYRLLQNGSPIGRATLTLSPGSDGSWIFTTDSEGTSGLASVLGARTHEVSRFRWVGDLPQGLSYDYTLTMAFKHAHRHVDFDWHDNTIDVDDNGRFHFAARPGALERHTVPLALAAGLAAGRRRFELPVAVRDRIETQHYLAHGEQSVRVPAGSFEATRVSRGDDDGIEAWFAPSKLPVPVKIDQRGKRGFLLELESWAPQS